MKLLNINYSDYAGGSAIACSRLHNAFLKNNLDSWLAICKSNYKNKNTLTFSQKKNETKYLFKKNFLRLFSKYYEKKLKNDFSFSLFDNPLFEEVHLNSFDIVNLHWVGNETISLNQINKIKKPKVWTLTDMWPFLGLEHINYSYYGKKNYWNDEEKLNENKFNLNNFALKKKIKYYDDSIQPVAISKWLANIASQSILFKNHDIKVIPCTLDFNYWKPKKNIKIKNTFFNGDKKIILFSSSAGTSDYKKGFSFLSKALKKFENLNDLHLVILGKLNPKDMKNINITYTELANNLFGDKDKLIEIYSSVDLVVMPSLIEAFGQVALEAASCNVPSVIFGNTGLEEIIDHKINGYIAKYKSSDDLYEGINWCLDNNNLNTLKFNCRDIAKKKFDNLFVVDKYLSLYKSLI